jgi:hypothetical protein
MVRSKLKLCVTGMITFANWLPCALWTLMQYASSIRSSSDLSMSWVTPSNSAVNEFAPIRAMRPKDPFQRRRS